MEKIYAADKEYVSRALQWHAIKVGGVLMVMAAFIIKGDQEMLGIQYLLMGLFFGSILFIIMVFGDHTFRGYKVILSETSIGFLPAYSPKEPVLYHWKDIRTIVIGNLTVKDGRLPYDVFGAEIFYKDKILENTTLYSVIYRLDHLKDYVNLIRDVKEMCKKKEIVLQIDMEKDDTY